MTTQNTPSSPSRTVAKALPLTRCDKSIRLRMLLLAGLAATLAFTVSGCGQKAVNTHGHVIPKHRFEMVKEGVTTKEGVRRLLGSPPMTGSFDENSWIYMSERTQEEIFGDSTLTGRTIYVLTFDQDDIVDSIEVKTSSDGKKVKFSEKTTPTSGQSMGVLDQLLGNIGVQ